MTVADPSRDIDRMLPPDEARAIIDAHLTRVGTETVPVDQAAGRILAEDIAASEAFPPFAASTMDGYAVLAADESPWREVLGTQHAGHVLDVEVTEGTTVKIMTGAPLPPGADAVVQVEKTRLMEDHVVIEDPDVSPGSNIRPIGADIAAGATVLTAGMRLGPAEVGLLASLGATPVPVFRKLRVSITSTGDELLEPDEPSVPGMIRDSNRFTLAAALASEPVEITFVGKAPDDRDQLEAHLRERLAADDIVMTSGGVSMGDKDYLKAILFDAPDILLHFRRLFMKPGKPFTFATHNDSLLFCLPGNPVSSYVGLEVLIRPALRRMIGTTDVDRPSVPVILAEPHRPGDRTEYVRCMVVVGADGRLVARTTGEQRSSRLASFLGCNGLMVVPAGETTIEAGATMQAILLGPPTIEEHP